MRKTYMVAPSVVKDGPGEYLNILGYMRSVVFSNQNICWYLIYRRLGCHSWYHVGYKVRNGFFPIQYIKIRMMVKLHTGIKVFEDFGDN